MANKVDLWSHEFDHTSSCSSYKSETVKANRTMQSILLLTWRITVGLISNVVNVNEGGSYGS